ncbi:MAG: hypothetical protein COW73_09925 [Nitrospirae bacterium CG18_big_fil_WC_8_21_14_2_50_70_55]|nr:hypothetical protein [Deltaproteobacteria bacterium]OIP64345.1 MAG: hypothetical protein AUK30_06930 [Nitrospirae bacterium CG2_30_70_394]PIQ03847.1 MAG: hypothetical protein COW73_09925 [Nitrospirae bacterium CG18_big_fil_WC_8_21_14_2_50_70_55]PIU79878.1 MAG: hypothetical protein COS73_02315 [Nitrospirae bacterium CG06_land_8_20_14_3_00_70_43]PIW83606.1 MAG: hypothetical protein COZ96_02480 [Nitrospirae bacterium CG_4_8_14_3_um_filter_70_85]PIX84474.1 MAG: hypothetical protein COZ33_00050 
MAGADRPGKNAAGKVHIVHRRTEVAQGRGERRLTRFPLQTATLLLGILPAGHRLSRPGAQPEKELAPPHPLGLLNHLG